MLSELPLNDKKTESLLVALENTDGLQRREARKALVAMGSAAIIALDQALQYAKLDHVRWEAAKALGEIGDPKAIPSLVKALEDRDADVAWLAAEALRHFKKDAWAPLLNVLLKNGPDSVLLCQRAHHVFAGQQEKGYDDLLKTLRNALESGAMRESAAVAAFEILKRMKAIS